MPWGVVDARRRAIADAAKDKAKSNQKLMEQVWANGAIQYQDEFDAGSIELMEKYGEATNWDFSQLSDRSLGLSRKFWEETTKWQTFGKQTIDANKRVEKLLKTQTGVDADKISLPPSTLKAMSDWYDASGGQGLKELYKNPKKFRRMLNEFKAYDDLTYKGNLITDKIKVEKKVLVKDKWDYTNPKAAANFEEAIQKYQHGNYDERYWAIQQFVDPKRLDAIIEPYMKNANLYIGDSREKTKEELTKYVLSNLGEGEIDISKLIAVHKNDYSNLGWARWNRQVTKEEERLVWTTALNNASMPSTIESLTTASMTPADSGGGYTNRESAYVAALEEMNVSPNVDADNKLIDGEVAGRIEVSDEKVSVRAGDWSWNGMTFTNYKKSLSKKHSDGGKLSKDEWYMLTQPDNKVFEKMPVSAAKVGYGYTEEGKFKTLRVYDGADKMAESHSYGEVTTGGTFKVDDFVVRKGKYAGKRADETTPEGVFGTRDMNGDFVLSYAYDKKTAKEYLNNPNYQFITSGDLEEQSTITISADVTKRFNENDMVNKGQFDNIFSGTGDIGKTVKQGEQGTVVGGGDEEQIVF
jgi:hypothetical protein